MSDDVTTRGINVMIRQDVGGGWFAYLYPTPLPSLTDGAERYPADTLPHLLDIVRQRIEGGAA